jgi:hypothetical protein
MNKIRNVKIQQKSAEMSDVTGAKIKLEDGENIHIKDMDISQNADSMQNVTGLSIEAKGKQSAHLQGVQIKQPNASIVISDDPNIEVTINKQE